MNKEQAKQIIRETFEQPFDKNRFVSFIKNLLNQIEESPFSYNGSYISDAYRPYISVFERIGKFNDGENRTDILIVKLTKDTSFERARTRQRNFIAGYLQGKYGSSNKKDAALVAFISPNDADWRFSLVRMDYRFEETANGKVKIEEEFTPARRWSFLVGVNEKSHTAQSQLVDMLADDEKTPNLSELEKAFNIEIVTKEFFLQYRNLFIRAKESLDEIVNSCSKIEEDFKEKNINTVDFAKKLLGQIVFLYFLQKKGWFGLERDADWGTGSKQFLRELFEKKHGDYTNFFNDILEPLFYQALRIDRSHDDDYYSHFKSKIPFLNGGLFDPIGNYDWVHTDILLPDNLFSNQNKTKQGDIGDGILDIFDRYNFTVQEDEPLEKEVAIDPELLGKAYEKFNAIRPDNFDEYKKALKSGKKGDESKFNKQYGVYYTPREIVHYMCQQSLINYLATESKISKDDIETFIRLGEQVAENEACALKKGKKAKTYSYKLPESIRVNASLIDGYLKNITVCDPAVGSGAFPVGMMSEIVKARNVLSPFINDNECTPYEFKRRCIEHSLYGVDIDPGAVEIAKLRLWLSLVVDEDDIKNIKPLPNLDYKIVCGNSLLGVEKDVFNSVLFETLEELKPLYFNETNPTRKQELKRKIDGLINQITNGHKEFDFEVYFSEVFHHKGGFDVVIANPPYVEHKKLKGISATLKGRFKTYSGTADLYVYFYEVALNVLKETGTLTFISSNKFIRATYGANLRKLLSTNRIHSIVDFTNFHIFDALVASCIIVLSKDMPNNSITITFADETCTEDITTFTKNKYIKVCSLSLGNDIWHLDDSTKLQTKQKIEYGTKKLGKIEGVQIFRGVTTGFNPAFIIDASIKGRFCQKNPKSVEIIKPILRGRDIRRYHYNWARLWMIFMPWHFPLHNDSSIQGASKTAEEEFKKRFPIIYHHLFKFKSQLEVRNKSETCIRYEWYAMQRCAATYYNEFEKEKIIWGLTANKWAFAYDNRNNYLLSNGYILTSLTVPIKYLLALLNSKMMEFYFSFIGIMTAGGAFTLKHETIGELPIKIISHKEQQKFIDLVDKILDITKDNDYLQNSEKQAKVKEHEKQIDQLVYTIYNLTKEEIKLIEKYIK